MKTKTTNFLLLLLFSSLIFTSCVAVKGYEQIYINDPDMLLLSPPNKRFEIAFHVYREGASGANGGKTGGGCGCN